MDDVINFIKKIGPTQDLVNMLVVNGQHDTIIKLQKEYQEIVKPLLSSTTALIAIEHGHLDLLKLHADITITDIMINAAIVKDQVTIAKYLKIKFNIKNYVVAAENSASKIIKYFAKCKYDPSEASELLQVAVQFDHLFMVKYLAKNGVDIHADNDRAFQEAAMNNSTDVTEFLIKNGADVNVDNGYALTSACEMGHYGIVELLLANGADVHVNNSLAIKNAINKKAHITLEILIANGAIISDDNKLASFIYKKFCKPITRLTTAECMIMQQPINVGELYHVCAKKDDHVILRSALIEWNTTKIVCIICKSHFRPGVFSNTVN